MHKFLFKLVFISTRFQVTHLKSYIQIENLFENQIPKLEDHIELTWVGLYELPNIDLKPEILKELLPDCLANPAVGIFRSVMI